MDATTRNQDPNAEQNSVSSERNVECAVSGDLGMFLANFDTETDDRPKQLAVISSPSTVSIVSATPVAEQQQAHTSGTFPHETKNLDNLEELLDSLAQPIENEVQNTPMQVIPLNSMSLDGQQVVAQQSGEIGHNQVLRIQMPVQGTGMGDHQIIPLDTSSLQLQGNNTVLLPIIPTLMPDGHIEMRVAGNAIPLNGQQSIVMQQTVNAEQPQQPIDQSPSSKQMPLVVNLNVDKKEPSQNVYEFEETNSQIPPELLSSIRTIQQQQNQQRITQPTKKTFQCKYCDYTNAKRYLLVRHMKSHSEERPHVCQICDRSFKTQSSLANHINTHTGLRPFQCPQCSLAFTTSGELVRHQRYKHTLERPHKCDRCDYATVELSKLKRHVRSHTGEKPYKCQYCEYSSSDTYKMKRHVRVHTGEKPYECDVCLARFTQSNSLKAHRLTHNPEDRPVFQCNFCPTTCSRKTDLRMHVEKQHMSAKPIPCKKCGRSFTDRYQFKVHWKSHDGKKCFTCEHCSYSAFTQRHLDQHMMVHSTAKPFDCPEPDCDRQFRQLSQLKRHHNMRHDPFYQTRCGEKKYTCEECKRSFRHLGNLKRHVKWHKEEVQDQQQQGDSLKVFDFKTTVGAPQRKKKKPGRKPRLKPEELGLTNIRKRGRPRKVPLEESAPGSAAVSAEELMERDIQVADVPDRRQEDLRQSFGFSCLAQRADGNGAPAQEQVLEEVLVDELLDSVPHDSSGFPLIDGTECQAAPPSKERKVNNVTMFDLDPDT